MRLTAQTDTNFQGWHTAVFSNDGRKVVFTDEWGGGTGPMCQANSMMEMGGNTTLTIGADHKYTQHAYFKIPTAQTAQENCVSHNGGLIPVPGRDVMVQGWYQGGVDVIDFTDADHPKELAYFDRGPIDPPAGADVPAPAAPGAGGRGRGPSSTVGGSWGAYYWNGIIYSSEIDRGFDILELQPTPQLSANEIAAAKLVMLTDYNPQSQPKLVWPAAFVVVRSIPRPARAQQRTRCVTHDGDLSLARRSRDEDRYGARCGADRAREAGGWRCGRREGFGEGSHDVRSDQGARGGVEVVIANARPVKGSNMRTKAATQRMGGRLRLRGRACCDAL